ncbi:MAG: YncE family protein [Gemmatimonadaceae bacterium]|nr:YncE family protein [Gemmatimonadaceae bacterium]NUQ93373.1 YncE family protein [Gemmatimonadaceae bacterium]NUR19689.1 YncE family protein [Gemmatimonadaceae bacterium]NUS96367.1 YncE family protein [Gemmatimonadaceae bacterium]
MKLRVFLLAILTACAPRVSPPPAAPTVSAPQAPDRDYLVFVASEGNDHVSLLSYGPRGISVERDFRVGFNPSELVGPHGIAVAPSGDRYFVTTAHGSPEGSLWKYSSAGDSLLGRVQLGFFPATVQVSPNGAYVWAVNFNLHGEMVPSSVSVVYAPEMVEVARIRTCTMPHGSRLSPDGSKHYSVCMMDDALVEIDAQKLAVARHFIVAKGMEHGMDGAPMAMAMPAGGAMTHAPSCSPTWAQPTVDGKSVFVACNKSNELVQIDVSSWTLARRIPAGDGVYNLAVTHDGRLLVGTNKRAQSVSVFDLATGKEFGRVATTRRLPSGVTVSSDDRYAFVTDEGVGSMPGTVDVIDLRAMAKVATIDVGQQAGGIDFWRTAPVGR